MEMKKVILLALLSCLTVLLISIIFLFTSAYIFTPLKWILISFSGSSVFYTLFLIHQNKRLSIGHLIAGIILFGLILLGFQIPEIFSKTWNYLLVTLMLLFGRALISVIEELNAKYVKLFKFALIGILGYLSVLLLFKVNHANFYFAGFTFLLIFTVYSIFTAFSSSKN